MIETVALTQSHEKIIKNLTSERKEELERGVKVEVGDYTYYYLTGMTSFGIKKKRTTNQILQIKKKKAGRRGRCEIYFGDLDALIQKFQLEDEYAMYLNILLEEELEQAQNEIALLESKQPKQPPQCAHCCYGYCEEHDPCDCNFINYAVEQEKRRQYFDVVGVDEAFEARWSVPFREACELCIGEDCLDCCKEICTDHDWKKNKYNYALPDVMREIECLECIFDTCENHPRFTTFCESYLLNLDCKCCKNLPSQREIVDSYFRSCIEAAVVDFKKDLLKCGDIEANPGPGKKQVSVEERLARLSLRDDDIGKKSKFKREKLVKAKRVKAAERSVFKKLFPKENETVYRSKVKTNKDNKFTNKPREEVPSAEFSWPTFNVHHKISIEIMDKFKEIVDSLPADIGKYINWFDAFVSIRVLFTVRNYEAKYLAVRKLMDAFKVEGVEPASFLVLLLGAFSSINLQQAQSSNAVALTSIATIVLTLVLGRKPKEDFSKQIIYSIGELPKFSNGMEWIVEVVKKILNKVSNWDEESVADKLVRLDTLSKTWMGKEGINFITLDERSFDEVCKAKIEIDDLAGIVPRNSREFIALGPVLSRITTFYKMVMLSPVAGHAYRIEPVVVQLVGKPGIGKTIMISALCADALKKIFELEGQNEEEQKKNLSEFFKYVYYRPVGHKYETNYNSLTSKIYVMDDANQVNIEALGEDLPVPAKLINYANSHDLLLPVAELENKRNAKFRSKLILMTDNELTPDLRYLACPEAYKRRITLQVTVDLKAEYKKVGPGGVFVADPTKFDQTKFDTSAYTFTVEGTDLAEKLNYDQLVQRMWKLLEEKDREFNKNRINFLSHSQRWFEPRQEVRVSEVDVPHCAIPRLESGEENFSMPPIAPRTNPKPSLLQHFINTVYACFGSSLVTLALLDFWIFDFALFNHYKRRIISTYYSQYVQWHRVPKSKRLAYLCAGGALLCSGIGLYLYSQKKGKKMEKYGDSDATKILTKPKTKPKPKGKLKIINSKNKFEVKVEHMDARDFLNAPLEENVADNMAFLLQRKVLTNSYEIIITNSNFKTASQRGFFVKGKLFAVNTHLVREFKDNWNESFISLIGIRGSYKNIPCSRISKHFIEVELEDGTYCTPYDTCFLEFPIEVADHADLSVHLSSRHEVTQYKNKNCIILTLNEELGLWSLTKQFSHIIDVHEEWKPASNGTEVFYNYGTFSYQGHTFPGYCGSVVLVNDKSILRKIMGIHYASFEHQDYCSGTFVHSEFVAAFEASGSYQYSLSDKHNKQVKHTRTVVDNSFNYVCTIDETIHAANKTRIRESIIHGEVIEPSKFPATLSFFDFPHGRDHVVNMALKKHLGENIVLNNDTISVFKALLLSNFMSRKVEILDLETAIRGSDTNEYIRAINRASSPGYPFIFFRDKNKSGKRTFLGEDDNFVFDHPLLTEEIEKYKSSVERNERPLLFFISSAKDELRTSDKIEAGKTRSFAAAPLHYVVMFRQQFLDFFSTIMENRIKNGTLVGINPYGSEWDVLATSLLRNNKRKFIAGDFSNFDGTLNRSLLWAMFEVIEEIYERDSRLSRALWTDITDSMQLYGNTVIEVLRGQPSGNPGTTIINSMYNFGILQLAIWQLLDEKEEVELRDNLSDHFQVQAYGDDNILAFSDELASAISPLEINQKMDSFGMKYTSDDKAQTNSTYRELSEISILKRRFVFDSELRSWLAPLELPSIFEPLNWDKVDIAQTAEKRFQTQTNAVTAIRELCLHTASVFDQWRSKIVKVCRENSIRLPAECYMSQQTLRKLLKFGHLRDCGKDIYLGCPDEQPSSIGPKQNVAENNSTPRFETRIATTTTEKQNILGSQHQEAEVVGEVPFQDETIDVTTGNQIVSFSTIESPELESVPLPQDVKEEFLAPMDEGRDHSILDILSREYAFEDFEIPAGGNVGDVLKTWNVLDIFLSQENVIEKVSGFAYFRADMEIRLEFTTVPTVSGGVMLSYFPDIPTGFLNRRNTSVMQLSQNPNLQQSLTTAVSMRMHVPWISPLYARDLLTGSGSIGFVILSRLTPSATNKVAVRAYISAKRDTIRLQYPVNGDVVIPASAVRSRLITNVERIHQSAVFTVSEQEALLKEISKQLDVTERKAQEEEEKRSLKVKEEERKKKEEADAKKTADAEKEAVKKKKQQAEAKVKATAEFNLAVAEATKKMTNSHQGDDPMMVFESKRSKGKVTEVQQIEKKGGVVSGILNTAGTVARVASMIPGIGAVAGVAAPLLNLGGSIAASFGLSKPAMDKPVRSVKINPSGNALNSEDVVDIHQFGVTKNSQTSCAEVPFGSEVDEMAIEAIMKTPNIIANFNISTSMPVRRVVYSAPLALSHPSLSGTEDMFVNHQMWIAQLFDQWLGNLNFDFDAYLTHFHRVKLRFMVLPSVVNVPAVGSNLPGNFDVNKTSSAVVEFSGDTVNWSIRIEPRANLAMKYTSFTTSTFVGMNRTNFISGLRNQESTYGTLLVAIEVPLQSTAAVSDSVHFVVSFSADDVSLSAPHPTSLMIPRYESSSTLGTSYAKMSRSERMIQGSKVLTSNSVPMTSVTQVELAAGERVIHLRNLMNAYNRYTSLTHTGYNSWVIEPYQVRSLSTTTLAEPAIDTVDYLRVGYAFFKGGMRVRLAMTYPTDGLAVTAWIEKENRRFGASVVSSTARGVRGNVTAASIVGGGRMIAGFAQEGMVDFEIPYWNTKHMLVNYNDIQGTNTLRMRTQVTTSFDVYRSVADDFRMGFLYALPPFAMRTLPFA